MGAASPAVEIRRARRGDAARIAVLSCQLGYPATTRQVAKRLSLVLQEYAGACFVADTREEGLVGWVHVSSTPLLEVQRRAEVNGLVVEEECRNQNIGWLLLEAAEKWAHKLGCKSMSVRSNVIRDRAHGFYLRHGYEHYKTQKAFRKAL
ncbi:MAG: GNAT family N-acetyltransferase [Candidatus Acidiferrum sp.]